MWLFHEGNKNTAELTYDQSDVNPEDRIRMDDIAENYYFASDLDANDFYTIYFFAQPDAASKSGTPDEIVSQLHDDKYGYWGGRTSSDGLIENTDNTSDGTRWGYKKFENVYRQLSTDKYNSLGQLFCTALDSSDWYGYFAGFTADPEVAKANLSRTQNNSAYTGSTSKKKNASFSVPNSQMLFDLNKPLSTFDLDEDRIIYLYAVYTNGVDYQSQKKPAIHLLKQGSTNEPCDFQWMFLPNKESYSGTYPKDNLDIYFSMKNIYVEDTAPANPLTNVFYKDTTYNLGIRYLTERVECSHSWNRHANSGGQLDNGWNYDFTDGLYDFTDGLPETFTNFIKKYTESGFYYNFYIYYNQRENDDGKSPAGLEKNIDAEIRGSNKIIAFCEKEKLISEYSQDPSWGPKDTTHSRDVYVKIYIERIYNNKLTGEITGSFDYKNSTGNILFNNTGNDTDTNGYYDVFETKEISFASSYDESGSGNRTFTFNYGSHYGDIVSADDAAVYDSTKNPSLGIKNPAGGDVFYGTEDYSGGESLYAGNFNKITVTNYADQNGAFPENDGAQKLPVITIAHPGVYKIRARVYYANGVPSAIKISVAYLRGLFIEVFDSNPSNLITETEFINHSNPPYKAFFNYQSNPLKPDDELFQDNDGNKYSLLTLLRDKYPDCDGFYDHVGGKNIRFDARRDNTTFTDSNGNPLKGQFTLDGGQTWIDEFPITKNFIFYPVKLPEQQTV